jgi:hypothetical protein
MIYLIIYVIFLVFDLYLALSKKVPDFFFTTDTESLVCNVIFMFLPGINILMFFIFVIGIISDKINKLYNVNRN